MRVSRTPSGKLEQQSSVREASAKIEALFSSMGEAIIVTDGTARITRVNDIALGLLGYTRGELLHKRFKDKIIAVYDNGKPINMVDRPIVQVFLTGKPVTKSTIYRRKDGTPIAVEVTVSPVILSGRPIGAIEVFHDITGEAKQEKLKSDFIAIASHQLRTPLSYINIYAQMLESGLAGDLNEQQRAFLNNVTQSVRTMNVLIDTLLNISRIESTGLTANYHMTNVSRLFEEIAKEAVPLATQNKIHLEATIPPDIEPINTDRLLVKQVCSNIISNALKYTPEGGEVNLSLTVKDREVIFSVRDSGLGIPLTSQKHIFSKFFRAGNVMEEEVSGTGLGLYLAKTIANQLGGDLWFESVQNKGSTFFFALPKNSSRKKTLRSTAPESAS